MAINNIGELYHILYREYNNFVDTSKNIDEASKKIDKCSKQKKTKSCARCNSFNCKIWKAHQKLTEEYFKSENFIRDYLFEHTTDIIEALRAYALELGCKELDKEAL